MDHSHQQPRNGVERIGNMKKTIALLWTCLALTTTAASASSRADLQVRVDAAKSALEQTMAAKDSTIPRNILQQATCVGVVPGLIKGACLVGARYGQGVVT